MEAQTSSTVEKLIILKRIANLDSETEENAIKSFKQLNKERIQLAKKILSTTDELETEQLNEYFEYRQREIKKVLSL